MAGGTGYFEASFGFILGVCHVSVEGDFAVVRPLGLSCRGPLIEFLWLQMVGAEVVTVDQVSLARVNAALDWIRGIYKVRGGRCEEHVVETIAVNVADAADESIGANTSGPVPGSTRPTETIPGN